MKVEYFVKEVGFTKDVFEVLEEISAHRDGYVEAIGYLKNPVIGWFEADKREYKKIELKGGYELLSLKGYKSNGNWHVHVVLGDQEGRAFGGHLFEGKPFKLEGTFTLN